MSDSSDGKRIVGFKQGIKAIKSEDVELVYLASDASANIVIPIMRACDDAQISTVNREHTMIQLGEMANIDVEAAVIVVLK
ncbi:MAG: ribosomal protein L7ae-like protein [Clostridia bacterium]|nr:ribosomal protein L7ae-like protein [Clostridia bacterium]